MTIADQVSAVLNMRLRCFNPSSSRPKSSKINKVLAEHIRFSLIGKGLWRRQFMHGPQKLCLVFVFMTLAILGVINFASFGLPLGLVVGY